MTLDLPRDEALEVWARCKTLKGSIITFQESISDQIKEIASYIDGQNGWMDEIEALLSTINEEVSDRVSDSLDPLIAEADHCFEDSFPPERPYFTRDLETAE